jgi:hypothetical protein
VEHLRRAAVRARRRRAAALAAERDAIRALAARVRADVERVAGARLAGRRKLGRALVDRHARLDRRLSAAAEELRARQERALAAQSTILGRLHRRSLIDDLLVASGAQLLAAFGQRRNPFAPNNLTVALLLLVWLVGDDIVDALSGGRRRSGPFARDADLWAYVAPLANLVLGWLLLRNQQHERFATGFADAFEVAVAARAAGPGRALRPGQLLFVYRQQIDLAPFVAPGHVEDFVTFADVPAVATITSVEPAPGLAPGAAPEVVGLSAAVDRGTLTIEVTAAVTGPIGELDAEYEIAPPLQSLRVAWIVDTEET